MGDLTRLEMRTELDGNLGKPLNNLAGSTLTDVEARLERVLHQSEIRIARGRSLRELNRSDTLTFTATGTPATDAVFASLPTNWRKIYSILWQEGGAGQLGRKLQWESARKFAQQYGITDEQGTSEPRKYTLWKNSSGVFQLEWFPVPNTSSLIDLRYAVWPMEMAQDTDTSELDMKDDLIIAWSTEWMFQATGELEDAIRWKDIRRELLAQIIDEEFTEPDQSVQPSRASDGGGYRSIEPWRDAFVRST